MLQQRGKDIQPVPCPASPQEVVPRARRGNADTHLQREEHGISDVCHDEARLHEPAPRTKGDTFGYMLLTVCYEALPPLDLPDLRAWRLLEAACHFGTLPAKISLQLTPPTLPGQARIKVDPPSPCLENLGAPPDPAVSPLTSLQLYPPPEPNGRLDPGKNDTSLAPKQQMRTTALHALKTAKATVLGMNLPSRQATTALPRWYKMSTCRDLRARAYMARKLETRTDLQAVGCRTGKNSKFATVAPQRKLRAWVRDSPSLRYKRRVGRQEKVRHCGACPEVSTKKTNLILRVR